MEKYNVIYSTWFTSLRGCVGIVVIENGIGEFKAYIGSCIGINKEEDEQTIASWGAKFPLECVPGFDK